MGKAGFSCLDHRASDPLLERTAPDQLCISTCHHRTFPEPDPARGVVLLLIVTAYTRTYPTTGSGADPSSEPLLDQTASFAPTLFLDNRTFPIFTILLSLGCVSYGLARSITHRAARGAEPQQLRQGLSTDRSSTLIVTALNHQQA